MVVAQVPDGNSSCGMAVQSDPATIVDVGRLTGDLGGGLAGALVGG